VIVLLFFVCCFQAGCESSLVGETVEDAEDERRVPQYLEDVRKAPEFDARVVV
jgi:hypothetical protein